MKKLQLTLLCLICFTRCYSQAVSNSYGRIEVEIMKQKNPKKIYTKVEIKSAFPGGDSSWAKSVESQLNQSIRADRSAKNGRYVVSVLFVVDKYGSIADIRCEKDPGFGMCEAVVRVLKKSPKWTPAEPVKVRAYRVTNQ